MEDIVGLGLGRDKHLEALGMLFRGEMQITVAGHFDVSPQSVNEFANHPDTKRSLERMREAFELEVARKGGFEVRAALDRMIATAKDPDVDASTRLHADKTILATFGFAPGRKVEHSGGVASVKLDLSNLPRELLDAYADGEGTDDLDIPDGLLEEVLAAQGEQ